MTECLTYIFILNILLFFDGFEPMIRAYPTKYVDTYHTQDVQKLITEYLTLLRQIFASIMLDA